MRRSWWHSIYQRVSQSGVDDEQENHLSAYPKRRSVSRPNDGIQALPLIKEVPAGGDADVYEDPPPPSTLSAYRSSGFANNERKVLRKVPPRTSQPIPDPVHRYPELTTPTANPPPQLGRSDSLFARVFTYLGSEVHATNTELDHGTESQSSRSSLWRAGSANVVSKHVTQRSSVREANVTDGNDPQPVSPAMGSVVGVDSPSGQDEELSTPPPSRSRLRDTADHFVPTPQETPPQQLPPVVWHDPPVHSPLPPHPPGIPEQNVGRDLSFPLPPPRTEFEAQIHVPGQGGRLDPRTVHPLPMPVPLSCLPPQLDSAAGPISPPNLTRPRRASRHEALLRPFPEPVHHPPSDMGPMRFTPPRGKLTIPTPLAQPLSRGTGSLKRNRTSAMPAPELQVPASEPYRESRSRKSSQPIPTLRHTADASYMPYPTTSPSRNPHRRTSRPLPTLQETVRLHASPPSSPPQQSLRRLPSPPMSALPPSRPTRSNAVHRKSLGSPTRVTSPRMSLLADLRSAQPMDGSDFSRYPVPGPGSGLGSPPRDSRTESPRSPRTPPFVNTHMLSSPPSSPRRGVEEWVSAVSSLPPSTRTKRS